VMLTTKRKRKWIKRGKRCLRSANKKNWRKWRIWYVSPRVFKLSMESIWRPKQCGISANPKSSWNQPRASARMKKNGRLVITKWGLIKKPITSLRTRKNWRNNKN
jgi:hypothetical protein